MRLGVGGRSRRRECDVHWRPLPCLRRLRHDWLLSPSILPEETQARQHLALAEGQVQQQQAESQRHQQRPQQLGTYTSPLNLVHPVGNGLPAVYVRCTQPLFATLQPAREWVKANGMRTVDIKAGHDAMISAPKSLTELLCDLAG